MWISRSIAVVLAAASLTACATRPSTPGVMVLPAPGKPLDEFRAEDLACRKWARQEGETQRRFGIAYQQCMYAKGNQIPGGRRSASPPPASEPAQPATQPPSQ